MTEDRREKRNRVTETLERKKETTARTLAQCFKSARIEVLRLLTGRLDYGHQEYMKKDQMNLKSQRMLQNHVLKQILVL